MNGFTPKSLSAAATLLLSFIMLLAASFHKLAACPFCLSPPQTLAEQIIRADIALIAELVRFRVYDGGTRPESTLRIREYIHGEETIAGRREFEVGQSIVIPSEATGKPGDLFLMFGDLPESAVPAGTLTFRKEETTDSKASTQTAAGSIRTASLSQSSVSTADRMEDLSLKKVSLVIKEWVSWNDTLAVTSDVVSYIRGMPPKDMPQEQRLQYFIPFLEHPDPLIAIDAWAEFGNSSYEHVVAVRNLLPPENLRRWIADPGMSPERLGLYGMMLGLCGTEKDAVFLLEQMYESPAAEDSYAVVQTKPSQRPFRFGAEGLMGGYLLLTGEAGLTSLEELILHPSDVPETAQHAMVQSLQFMWSYESDIISQMRIRTSMRLLLKRDSMREIAITNLSRWEDWESLATLIRMFETDCADDRSSQKAILQFAQTCNRSGRVKGGDAAAYAAEAELFLCTIHATRPELVATNSREFRTPL